MAERRISGLGVAVAGAAAIPLVSLLIDLPFHFSTLRSQLESPFVQGGAEAAAVNLAFFLAMVLAGTVIMIIIVKLGKIKLLPLIFSLSVFLSFFVIAELYFEAYCEHMAVLCGLQADIAAIALSLATSALILKPRAPRLLSILLILYGAMAGSLFFELLPPWSVVAIAAGMAAYDVYAVFRGPLRYILENVLEPGPVKPGAGEGGGANPLRGASVQLGGITLGMGDVLIYSMLSPLYYYYPHVSLARWLVSTAGIVAGFYVTIKMLEKRKFMPALPLPVAASLVLYGLSLLAGL